MRKGMSPAANSCRTYVKSAFLMAGYIGLDPPLHRGNSCGIVVCAMDKDGIAHVLADLTATAFPPKPARASPSGPAIWRRPRRRREEPGRRLIRSVLRAVDADLPIRLVAATRSKRPARSRSRCASRGAGEVAGIPELRSSSARSPGRATRVRQPDRADAMVWAMTELFDRQYRMPRVRCCSAPPSSLPVRPIGDQACPDL